MAQDATAADDPIARVTSLVRSSVPDTHMLAHVVGEAPAGAETAAYIPSTWALRSEARDTIHLRAVADIARLKFAFPNREVSRLQDVRQPPAAHDGRADGRRQGRVP